MKWTHNKQAEEDIREEKVEQLVNKMKRNQSNVEQYRKHFNHQIEVKQLKRKLRENDVVLAQAREKRMMQNKHLQKLEEHKILNFFNAKFNKNISKFNLFT